MDSRETELAVFPGLSLGKVRGMEYAALSQRYWKTSVFCVTLPRATSNPSRFQVLVEVCIKSLHLSGTFCSQFLVLGTPAWDFTNSTSSTKTGSSGLLTLYRFFLCMNPWTWRCTSGGHGAFYFLAQFNSNSSIESGW